MSNKISPISQRRIYAKNYLTKSIFMTKTNTQNHVKKQKFRLFHNNDFMQKFIQQNYQKQFKLKLHNY